MSERTAKTRTPRVNARFESRQVRVDRLTSTANSPQLLVIFSLNDVTCHGFRADTSEEQAELERRLKLIQSGLDCLSAIWRGSTGPTE